MIGLALAGCVPDPGAPPHLHAARAVSPARCAANRAAGQIVFLTSFGYAASSGILDVLTAQRLGWFDALCLDVAIRPGSTNAQLISAGTAQIAGLGDAASAMVAIDRGAALIGIATYGNTSAVELITLRATRVPSLAGLAGRIVGYKVAVAPQVIAMFANARVAPQSVRFVAVPFNPRLLSDGQVAAMIGYKSNEPRALAAAGYPVTEWDPERFGVHSTFNVLVANKAWAAAHPDAVADFLRATLRAYAWIAATDANLDRALGYAADLSTAGFDRPQSRARWRFEAALIGASQPLHMPLGYNDPAAWRAEAQTLSQARLVHGPIAAGSVVRAYDNRFIQSIYAGNTVIWPVP